MTGTTAGNDRIVAARTSRRGLLVACAALAAMPLLTACEGGFRPLYGSAALGGANVTEKFAQVEFAPIPGRVGQRLRNELIFQATGGGLPVPPTYRLEIAVSESVTSTLVKTNGDALSSVFNLDANFRLVRLSDRSVVLQGSSFGRASFERAQSIFSNVRAQEDAENRAAKTVGEELRTRLSAYLATAT